MAERIALNFMQRMSGIATATQQMVKAVQVCTFSAPKQDRLTRPRQACIPMPWLLLDVAGPSHDCGGTL